MILIRYRPNLWGGGAVSDTTLRRSRVHNGVGRFTYSGCSSPLPEIEAYCKCSSDACIDADAPNQSSTLSVDRPLWLISAARVGLPETPPQNRHPKIRHTPPEADSGTRSASGRYASYWNAFLCRTCFHLLRFRLRSLSQMGTVPILGKDLSPKDRSP